MRLIFSDTHPSTSANGWVHENRGFELWRFRKEDRRSEALKAEYGNNKGRNVKPQEAEEYEDSHNKNWCSWRLVGVRIVIKMLPRSEVFGRFKSCSGERKIGISPTQENSFHGKDQQLQRGTGMVIKGCRNGGEREEEEEDSNRGNLFWAPEFLSYGVREGDCQRKGEKPLVPWAAIAYQSQEDEISPNKHKIRPFCIRITILEDGGEDRTGQRYGIAEPRPNWMKTSTSTLWIASPMGQDHPENKHCELRNPRKRDRVPDQTLD